MADDRKPQKDSTDQDYRKLLKGEISSKEYVQGLKRNARSNRNDKTSSRRGTTRHRSTGV